MTAVFITVVGWFASGEILGLDVPRSVIHVAGTKKYDFSFPPVDRNLSQYNTLLRKQCPICAECVVVLSDSPKVELHFHKYL